MSQIERGKINCVITYSLSRIARNTKHLLETLEFFQEHNVRFISISESIDTNNSMAKILLTILGAIAEFEADLISSRVKTGLEAAKAKGIKLGRQPTVNKDLIKELAKKNYSQKEIASLVKCSPATVSRALKK